MITLAFDTCLDKMYAALEKDGKILSSRVVENHDNKYHSAFLISTLREIMSTNEIKPKEINLIAVNIGPGSFTGIRACVTAARVMAQQLNCKTAGISSLEILAKASQKNLVALDARKESAYLYLNGEIKGAVPIEEVKQIIENGNFEILTDDKLQPLLGGTSYQKIELPIGETIVRLAQNRGDDWRKLKPLYIQPPPMGYSG